MSDAMISQLGLGLGGIGGLAVLLRMVFVQWMKQNPSLEQAGANSDLYALMRADIKLVRKELRLIKRQVVLLEHLCLEKGIDVHSAYKEAGILDLDDDEPETESKK